jgi:hypothetical protein
MRGIYHFFWDYGRMGEVTGVFVAEDSDVKSATGKKVYFGEILGKHSEVHGFIKPNDIQLLTDNQDFIDLAEQYGLVPTGYNPLDYMDNDD